MKFFLHGSLFLLSLAAVLWIAGLIETGNLPLWGFLLAVPCVFCAARLVPALNRENQK